MAGTLASRRQAAGYLRISNDKTGEGLGVERQREDIIVSADADNTDIVEWYVDNDISAYSGKRRPRYEDMLADAQAGSAWRTIWAWNPDRLHRRTIELERFIDIVKAARVQVATVKGGNYDLSTPQGQAVAKIIGATAQLEIDNLIDRVRRKHEQLAMSGKPTMGGHRPFGYNNDRITICEEEAEIIRRLAQRVLAGEALFSLANELNRLGITTTTGKAWRPSTVRQMLMSARLSGRREHHGEIVSTGDWPEIICVEDSDALRALFTDPKRRVTPGNARSHLLSGMLICGKCNSKLVARNWTGDTSKPDGHRRYGCYRNGTKEVCGSLTVIAVDLEDFIRDAILYRLDDPGLRRALTAAGRGVQDETETELHKIIERAEAVLAELGEMVSNEDIEPSEYNVMSKGHKERRDDARRRLNERQGVVAVSPWIGKGKELTARWDALPLSERRAIIASLADSFTIMPARRGANRFDKSRVHPQWRHVVPQLRTVPQSA